MSKERENTSGEDIENIKENIHQELTGIRQRNL